MIDIRDLTLTYQGPKGPVEALKHINLHIEQGEIFGIIGRSGAGKSSLVRCINLLNRPTSGQMIVDGRDLMTLGDAQLRAARHEIGMVFQHFNLLSSRTVYDNAALPLELAGMNKAQIQERIDPLLELVGLSHLADRYPAQISGGQKQRVGIARALSMEPQVLLMDEPFGALDALTRAKLQDELLEIVARTHSTVVMVTHDVDEAVLLSDKIVMMTNGPAATIGEVLHVPLARPRQRVEIGRAHV